MKEQFFTFYIYTSATSSLHVKMACYDFFSLQVIKEKRKYKTIIPYMFNITTLICRFIQEISAPPSSSDWGLE